MRIKFYAKPEHAVHAPGPKRAGQVHNFLGRLFVATEDGADARVAGQNRATEEGVEVELNSPEGQALAQSAREGGLWAATLETAQAVGIEFVKVKYDSNAFEWFPDAAPAKPSTSKE